MEERVTYYKRKRIKAGLSKMDMANELGLNYGRYASIEKGDVKMPSNLIDKFNEIINRGTQNDITKIENKNNADEFWKEMQSLDSNGERNMYVKMREFNINSIQELALLLGYKSAGTIHSYLGGSAIAGDEFKKRLYAFFSDELNIQIPHERPKRGKKKKEKVSVAGRPQVEYDKDLAKYYEKTDFKELMNKYNISNNELARAICVHPSIVSRLTNKKERPGEKTLLKVRAFFDQKESEDDSMIEVSTIENPEPTVVAPEIPFGLSQVETTTTSSFIDFAPIIEEPEEDREDRLEYEKEQGKSSVIRRYEEELTEIDEMLKMYKQKVKEMETRKKVCMEVIDAINEYKSVEE